MTTLKNLKGTAIQFLAEDPVEYVGTWASGGSMNTARESVGSSSAGTQTASIAFGGSIDTGDFHRSSPIGGLANGIPLNMKSCVSSSYFAEISLSLISTTIPISSALIGKQAMIIRIMRRRNMFINL